MQKSSGQNKSDNVTVLTLQLRDMFCFGCFCQQDESQDTEPLISNEIPVDIKTTSVGVQTDENVSYNFR